MIHVTRLNQTSVVLNSDLIEHIESTPDTVISMTTGQRITVLESTAALIEAIRAWRHSLLATEQLAAPRPDKTELPAAGIALCSVKPEAKPRYGGI